MTRDKNELEAMVRAQFPLVFSVQDPVEAQAYAARWNALIDYATAVSAPPLSAETIRYQTMLLAGTLLFLSFGLFKVSSFKIADAIIALDWKAFFFYGLFLIGVAAIFTFKAWVDYDRAGFSRAKNAEAIGEVRHLIEVGQLSENAERYYREQLDRAINNAYRVYDEKMAASTDGSLIKIHDFQSVDLDVAAMRAIPELAGAIERHEAWLAEVRAKLEADVKHLVDKADEALLIDRLEAEKVSQPFLANRHATEAIRAAYAETLAPWIEMRKELASKGVKVALDHLERSFINGKIKELNYVLRKVLRIRRWTFRLEVILPLIFATSVILLVAWQVENDGLPKPPPPATAAPASK